VGDLTPEIDDLQLYRFFSARFKTIVSAKGKPIIEYNLKTSHSLENIFLYIKYFSSF
jgi:hypothetical protein